MEKPMKKLGLTFFLLCLWLLALAFGAGVLVHYEITPGSQQSVLNHWPDGVPLKHQSSTLVMALHPHCPCSRASLRELEVLLAQVQQSPLTIYFLFYQPSAFKTDWKKTDLWEKARRVKNAQLVEDIDGRYAKRFHSNTSGEVLLFDVQGRLQFQGGITPSRGHEGDNVGRKAIVSLLTEGTGLRRSAVFGCPIQTPVKG